MLNKKVTEAKFLALNSWIFFGLILTLYPAQILIAEEKFDVEKNAYETYLGCYNQLLWSSEKSCKMDGLSIELIRCTDLARMSLDQSKSSKALRYLAYLQLIDTDGGVKYSNNIVIAKKGHAIKPYLIEASKLAGKTPCLVPGIELLDKAAPNLCNSEKDARREIDEHLSRISKTTPEKKSKHTRPKRPNDK